MNDNPRVLGNRYEVGELLGRGGMAEVHLGRDARLGRAVAIKLLRVDLARDSTFQARFRREAQSAAALNHPAIVAVYDTGEEQVVESGGGVFNLPYIVMEHVEGRTLRDVLSEGHHLDIDSALDIITGVLTALEYSHRIGIVHRDIKPANVMLTPIGDVKVMDFGIARAMSDASSTMTQTQAVIGTAQYLSPEQARGEQVDTRSDLYSAGCLLYELLTGRPPFTADSPVAVAYQHVREPPIPPSQVIGGIPNSVDQIVLHSLAKGRDERYQTAADFRADVEAARGGRQVSAAVPVMHGSNATTQFVPVQDPTGTRVAPAAGMGAAGGLLGQTAAGGQTPADQYGNPYTQDQYAQDQYNRDQYNRDQYNRDQYGQDDQGRRQQRDQSGSNWKMILAGLAVVIVVALVGYLVVNQLQGSTGGDDQTAANVKVPGVLKKLQTLATEELDGAGFKVEVKKATSTEAEAGTVTAQDPGAGELAKKGSTVVITVGSGPNTVPVPDLRGMTQDEATDALKAAKLKVGTVTTVDDPKIPKGQVVRSEPPAEDDVARNSKVDLVLASGAMEIPDLTNKTEGQARSALKKAGFKVKVVPEPSEVEPGRVSRTDPEAGNSVSIGSTVTVFISQPGDDPTTEPVPSNTDVTSPPDSPTPTEPSPTSSVDPSNDDDG